MNNRTSFCLGVWYVHCILHDFVLIYPTYALLMQDTGVGPAQFASLLAIWSAAMLIFEVPSGVVGDLFPRRFVLIIAGCIRASAFATWFFWPTYWGFAVGFVIWSLGSAFHSGTSEAFLYESLADKARFDKFYGRTEAAYGVGAAAALFTGGFVAERGYELPLMLSVVAPIAAAALLLLFFSNPPRRPAPDDQSFLKLFREGFRAVLAVRVLAFLVSMSAVLAAIPGILEEFLGPLLDEDGFSLTAVGVAYGLVWLGRTIGNMFAHRLRWKTLSGVSLLPLVAAVVYLAGTSGSAFVFVAAFVVYFAIFGVFDVLLGARLQREIEDHHRATVTSVASMAVEASAIVYALIIGSLAEVWGWASAFAVSNVASIVFTLMFFTYGRKLAKEG